MSKRREGREAAVQYLYQLDIHGDPKADLRAEFWKLREGSDKVKAFADALVDGVLSRQVELDDRIRKYAQNFVLERLTVVDRNILRVAIFEMFHNLEVPPIVAINEAIEIAKRLGGQDSGKFVNGVLDKVKGELTRPLRDAVVPYSKSKG
jgi:transcription antitermination protein NusB